MARKSSLFLALFFLLLPPQNSSQQSKTPPGEKAQEALQYEVVVTLKLVQVFVTDKDGRPAMDLKVEDFILFQDGQPMIISAFEKHIAPIMKRRPEEKPVVFPAALPQLSRKFFIILDFERNDPYGVIRSKTAALHFLDNQVQPGDEVALFYYSNVSGIVFQQYLTSNHEAVRAAIKNIRQIPGIVDGGFMGSGGLALGDGENLSHIPFYEAFNPASEEAKTRATNFAERTKEMVKSLRSLPGYKNIILFSRGQPQNIYADVAVRDKYEDLGRELASSNTPLYAVNTDRNPQVFGVESLRTLSEVSGGKYFVNIRNYEQLAEDIQKATSNYFVLGYYVDEKWDGRYHEIEVKIRPKGLAVRAQKGYYSPKPFAELSTYEKQLQLIELALSDNPYFQDPLPIPLVSLPSQGSREDWLLMLGELSPDVLSDIYSTKMEFVALVKDEKGVVDLHLGTLSTEDLPKGNVYAYCLSGQEPGKYSCRLVIRNAETGRAVSGSASIVIPERQDSSLSAFPALLLIPQKPAEYMNLSQAKKSQEPDSRPSISGLYPVLSNSHAPVVRSIDKNTKKLLCLIHCVEQTGKDVKVQIAVELEDIAGEKKFPVESTVMFSMGVAGSTEVCLELTLPKLNEGEYAIHFLLKEPATAAECRLSRTFRAI